jgi:hypothetical protein|tara:strand:+ start:1452 stop:1646 length:195 start_codon:yes stop_codon:yes gene_type:complete
MVMDNDKQLGKLEAQVESLQRQMEQLSIDVKCVSDVMTKWKGAGVLLLILGASFGWLVDIILGR